MLERFRNLTEEQLNIGIAIMGTLCLVALLSFGVLQTSPRVRSAVGLGEDPAVAVEPTTVVVQAELPPTWTPRATNTPTATPTPPPTATPPPPASETPAPSPTLEEGATEEPDFAATIAAAQSATPPPAPPPPPATSIPAPPAPVAPPPPPAPTSIPAPPPPPTSTPSPVPTPLPTYVLAELLGGPNCGESSISGTIRNVDGTARTGVQVQVFNEFGYLLSPVTDGAGRFYAFLDSRPRADLAGPWHIRVMEDGIQASNEYVVIMSGSCTAGENFFVLNFYRTR